MSHERNRERKHRIRNLQRLITSLQIELAGKRNPHGEVVCDARGYAIRTKWPSNFNRSDRELSLRFRILRDARREVSELAIAAAAD